MSHVRSFKARSIAGPSATRVHVGAKPPRRTCRMTSSASSGESSMTSMESGLFSTEFLGATSGLLEFIAMPRHIDDAGTDLAAELFAKVRNVSFHGPRVVVV